MDKAVKEVLLKIVERGILNMRLCAGDGNIDQVVNEANHVHNLPYVILSENKGALDYYMTVEKPSYLRDSDPIFTFVFRELWQRLEELKALSDCS